MIVLHRLGHPDEPFHLNSDLIQSIEHTPDTVVTLTTTQKIVVAETPEQVVAAVRAYRVGVLAEALDHRPLPRRGATVHTLDELRDA